MPVSYETLLTFIVASFVLLIIPGPTIIMVVAQALAHGKRVALASVVGVGLGDLAAASLSIIGVGTILAASATVFAAVKWAGAAYLIYIGVKMWMTPVTIPDIESLPAKGSRRSVFRDSFLVTLLNPKGIIFFMAFVPQFISSKAPFAPQAAVFVLIFVVLGIVNAWAYAMLASSARNVIRRPSVLRTATRTGACFLIGAGVFSVLARRTA
ncbi:LysE family translocator [Hoeflea sp. TYP-13]|uniref:LysE family translocator n=1 Tax=Hoeflea sp. TYP-13 TaxID=3230023 RepID=UPI0034C6BA41